MSKGESFIQAIRLKKTDPVPFVIRFTVEAEEKFRDLRNEHFEPAEDRGTYAVISQTNSGRDEIKPRYFRESPDLLSEPDRIGGYIFSPSHVTTGDLLSENIEIMLKIADNQALYLDNHDRQETHI